MFSLSMFHTYVICGFNFRYRNIMDPTYFFLNEWFNRILLRRFGFPITFTQRNAVARVISSTISSGRS